jgi:uncharacterized protein (DUF2267 family)
MRNDAEVQDYYEHVQHEGKLLSYELAQRWSTGVLKTLGFQLSGRTKRALGKMLPEPLCDDLKDVFFLLHFRDPSLSQQVFQKQVAMRSGNTNAEFARFPILAVFSGIRRFTNSKLDKRIGEALSPEIQKLWEQSMEQVGV